MSARSSSRAVELGCLGGEIVVELGQDLFPHLLDLDREDGVFAGELLGLVVVGEGDLDLTGLATGCSGELLLEALDQLAAAELEQVVARLAALEGLAVEQTLEVDQQHVSLGRGAIDRLQLGEAFADPFDLTIDEFLRRLGLGLADLEALVLAQFGLGADADLELEGERLALGLGRGDDLDAGIADRRDAGAEQRPFVPLRQRLADRLLEHGGEADPLDHQRRRRLALAEAGHAHLPGEAAGSLGNSAVDIGGGNLDLDADARVRKL